MKTTWISALALAGAVIAPLPAAADELQRAFDDVFGNAPATPRAPQYATPGQPRGFTVPRTPASPFEYQLASLASPAQGRIGVAALDLTSGREVAVLGDQPFPLASTGKIAIVATFLEGVDQGRYHLDDMYPLMLPLPSRKLDGPRAPVRQGTMLPAQTLINLALERSDNHATDAILAAIGGPPAVDRWLRKVGMAGIHLDRDIATLVRDDGIVNPATTIDVRDSTTPLAMVRLLAGLYQGEWLSTQSRDVLFAAMARCATGIRRMKAGVPGEALVGHKTGTLANTSSDVGIIRTAEGRTLAVAIYVTGQGNRPGREARIASIARGIYEGYRPATQMAGNEVSR
ncbi:MAG: serine hydrolase [Sphingomonadales bacterium]|nr:serine hydrolase [Sphingomonadales bacterium]